MEISSDIGRNIFRRLNYNRDYHEQHCYADGGSSRG